MPSHRLRPSRTASLGALGAMLVLAGCGVPDRNAQAGISVVQDGVAYSVQTSRALNPSDPGDRQLVKGVRGRLEGPNTTLVGVFLEARDDASRPRRAIAGPEMVDAFGRVYRPLRPARGNPYAYRGGRIEPGEEIPGPDSLAAQSIEGGAALVYRLPSDVFLTDRPFVLRFGPGDRDASVQLDL